MKNLNASWAGGVVRCHWGKMFVFQAIVLVGIGYLLAPPRAGGTSNGTPQQTAATAATEPAAAPEVWSCSMHPQIRQNGPGKCPLCGMDLVPVAGGAGGGGGARTLTVSPAARALMNIATAPVERKYVTHEVLMVGKVDYDETRLKYITAWVPGRLDRLYVDFTGVEVKKGDHMVYIYSEVVYSAQEELITALRYQRERNGRQERVDLVASAREKLRLWGLNEQQIAAIEQQQSPTDHITIYSPIGGIVIEKLRQEGDRVALGDRIYTVADLTQVWIHLDAYESDLMWLRYGQEVTFTTEAYPGEQFVGRIAFIQPVLNDKTRTVKVRVNVPNPNGKLLPEMFGHGASRVQVAVGGRVVEPGLAGKWISPMHPEIIKDEPGKCDVCGMPLVRAETLGFLTSSTNDAAKPLVIPVSAALVTGRRAIVYVELPDADQPTFEGREIVLGPKAGDYYIVQSGLGEGERVVTQGNFKIDSEIQIQAKPSMMTPYGGGGEGQAEGLPLKFRKQMGKLVAIHDALADLLKDGDFAQIRAAFDQVDETLNAVDAGTLSSDALNVWNDLSMLLANDVVEGRNLDRMTEANRVYTLLTHHMQRLSTVFGLEEEPPEPQRIEVTPEFQKQLAGLWTAYLPIQRALAADDFDKARQGLAGLESAAAVDDSALSADESRAAWTKEQANLDKVLQEMQQAGDIQSLRATFAQLSDELGALITVYGLGDVGPMYRLHCSMAIDGRGAIWFQDEEETANPYYGEAMLGCADDVELLSKAEGAPQ
ncbi:MAG: hypothetical protein BMS9Abin04_298 [Planctomycetia bacterium]|nr:MAG: hypothetical protein BMS9Abin04_298 [Planctomycetia bacterium]